MNIKPLLILLLSISSLSSCGDKDSIETERNDYSVDVRVDIKYFNTKTGELTLKSGQIVSEILSSKEAFMEKVGLFSTISFYLDGNPVFKSIPIHPEYSSKAFNDLVFVIDDTKFYLLNGYPSLESLGPNKSESEKVRNKNFLKRKTNWDNFISYLRKA